MAYITEKNCGDIKNGSVLTLCPSVIKNVASILDSINMGDGAKKLEALKQLSMHSSDVTFVHEFVHQQGMILLINIIEGGGWDKSPQTAPLSEVVGLTLGCFLDLMDHGMVSWDLVDQAFISKVSSICGVLIRSRKNSRCRGNWDFLIFELCLTGTVSETKIRAILVKLDD